MMHKPITALAFDPDNCFERDFHDAHISNVTLCPTASAEQLYTSVSNGSADLVLLHFDLPEGMTGIELMNEVRKIRPGIRALLLAPHFSDEQFRLAAKSPLVQLMETPITSGKWDYFIARLQDDGQPPPKPLKVQYIDELRNDDTGRLDAKKVGDVFNLPVSTIATCIGKPRATVDKTPDSMAVQAGLRHFERIASSLLSVTGSVKGLRMWLNSPNPEFEAHTPLDVIKLGQVEMLADWVDDARLGNPD
jgi:hypothetical protein